MSVAWATSVLPSSSPFEPGRLGPNWGPCTALMRGLPTPRILTTRADPRQATVHDSAGLTLSLPRVWGFRLTVQGHCTSGTVQRVCTVAKSSCKPPLVVQVRLCVPVELMCVTLLPLWPSCGPRLRACPPPPFPFPSGLSDATHLLDSFLAELTFWELRAGTS